MGKSSGSLCCGICLFVIIGMAIMGGEYLVGKVRPANEPGEAGQSMGGITFALPFVICCGIFCALAVVATKKPQGAKARKVHAVLQALKHPGEVVAAVRLKMGALPARAIVAPAGCSDALREDVAFCDDMLGKVSRSFSAVIRQLPDDLCLPICVFYLVLRALDTIEDETDLVRFDRVIERAAEGPLPEPPTRESRLEAQRGALRVFHRVHPQAAEGGQLPDLAGLAEGNVGREDEATLLREYHRVINVFRALPQVHQEVIEDICKKMGNGMADYVGRDMGEGTEDFPDYNQYCHYVAGLVGEGLTRQFHVSGLEPYTKESTMGKKVLEQGLATLSSDMGLMLQKTNIIRDYLEDLNDGRSWWPRSCWLRHAEALKDFAQPEHREKAVACLNELVVDALELAPRCLAYMECLNHPAVIAFCAVPQVMAMMTLAELYDNGKVFEGVVKIRKTLAARILLNSYDMQLVRGWFASGCRQFRAKIEEQSAGSSVERVQKALDAVEALVNLPGVPVL